MLFHQSLDFQTDQAVQTHLKDRRRLALRKPQFLRLFSGSLGFETDPFRLAAHQTCLCRLHIPAAPKNLNNQIDHVACLDQALLDLFFVQFPVQKRPVLSGIQFKLKINHMIEDLLKTQRLRTAVRHRQHIDSKGVFQTGLLIEHIDNLLGIGSFFQFQHDPDTLFGRLVCNIHNIRSFFCLYQSPDIIEEFPDIGAYHGVGNFRDNDLFFSPFDLFHFHLAADLDLSGSCLVDLRKFVFIGHDSSGGEVRSRHDLQQILHGHVRIFHISRHGVDGLSKIVRRDTGRHTHRDPFRAIDQQMGKPGRKHAGLFFCLIKIGHKVHHVFVQICQQRFLADFLQARLGVTHGCRPISFNGAEIAVSVHQRKSLFEVLAHDYQSFIDRAVAVRMIFTHGIAYDTGAFPVRTVVADPQLMHIVQRPSLHRFQPVPHIRQSAGHDDAHGIVDIGLLHDVRIFCFDNCIAHAFPPRYPAVPLRHFHR